MTSTPATITRLKVHYGDRWLIREVRSGHGWTARHRETRTVVFASTPQGLETVLRETEHAEGRWA